MRKSVGMETKNVSGKEVKVGNICFKALQSARDKKYGKEEKQKSAGH